MRQPQVNSHSEDVPDPGIVRVLAEIENGDGLTPKAAGKLFPGSRSGTNVNPSAVWRWIANGSKAPNGETVRLEAVRVGNRWLTSRAAVARFVAKLSAAPGSSTPAPAPPRSPNRRRTAASKAEAELQKLGV